MIEHGDTVYREVMLRCWEAVPGDRPSTGDLVTTLESLLGEEGEAEYEAMFREYMDHKPLILREGNSAEREKCGDKTPAEASSGYIQMSEAVGESNHYIQLGQMSQMSGGDGSDRQQGYSVHTMSPGGYITLTDMKTPN